MAVPGQTINDRLNAVRYALAGQGLARTVCKATTLEVLGPKKKHIDYLIACTNEPNVSTPQLANLLIERTQHSNWAAVFKSLITIHHLMSYGNERFSQYLATSNHSFELDDFMDRTTPQGYNMSAFVRRYAKYINNKSISYRTLAIDLCKIRSGNDNALRTMNMDNLSKTLPIVQAQFDSLLEFCAEPKDLNNGIIMAAFRLLYKDLVRLYVAYQEAIINLLERYFKLSRKKTREALEMYKKYLARMNKVAGFLQVVDAVELDKSEMPDLTNSPASILKLLEQHLDQLEAKKHGGAALASPELDQVAGEGDESPTGDERPTSGATSEVADLAAAEDASGAKTAPQKVEPPNKPPPAKPTTAAVAASVAGDQPKPKPIAATEPAERPTPPQKPARPSPKGSPKVSPASQKPAAPVASSAAPSPPPPISSSPAPPPPPPPPPAAVASGAEKKGPPERPAKPPSRPPPPSSASASSGAPGASSSSSTPTACAPAATEPAATSHHDGPPATTQAKVAAASPTPPPPPPPPLPIQTHTSSSPAPAAAASTAGSAPNEQQPEAEAHQPASTNANTNGGGGDDHQPAEPDDSGVPAHTCSGSTVNSEHTVESVDGTRSDAIVESEANEQSINHVNNNGTSCQVVAAAEDELVPPPPPPPIDDNEFENIQQQELSEAEALDGAPQEPIVNGQSGHEGAE